MNRTLTTLVALTASMTAAEAAQPACVPEERVKAVAQYIPKHFKEVRHETYLIDENPEAPKTSRYAGQLSVYIPRPGPSKDGHWISIFDRSAADPRQWYNIANKSTGPYGCVEQGIGLGNARDLDLAKSQERFNAFVNDIYARIPRKK